LRNVEFYIFSILSKDYDSSFLGPTFIENLIWIEVFENYLSKTKKKKFGIFLLENQAWEKAMITSWKNYNHGEIIGYTPTSINFWHLYNFDNANRNYASPSKVFVSSNNGFELLKSQYQKKKIDLFKVESLWFNYLLSIKKTSHNKEKNILILGDYNLKNNYRIFEIIKNSKILKAKKIFFKPHPHDLHKYELKNIILTNRSNEYFFKTSSLVISAGSTAAILEYLYFGKKVFIYDDPYGFDLSPLKHLNYQFKFKSVKDLNRLLKVKFNKKKITNNFNNYYFLNKELKKWKNILYI
jgi:surface carbohydrate biosynthesis protein (TIGR04326 family)